MPSTEPPPVEPRPDPLPAGALPSLLRVLLDCTSSGELVEVRWSAQTGRLDVRVETYFDAVTLVGALIDDPAAPDLTPDGDLVWVGPIVGRHTASVLVGWRPERTNSPAAARRTEGPKGVPAW